MKQSRATSFTKSLVSTAVGFAISFLAQILILPLLGVPINLTQNTIFAIIMTVISVARGYLLERAFEAMGWRTRMSAFATAVLAERERQKHVEGWSECLDDERDSLVLAAAGASYAVAAGLDLRSPPPTWPWDRHEWKPYNLRRDLIRACALIIAEGERADRRKNTRASPGAASEPELEERRVHV